MSNITHLDMPVLKLIYVNLNLQDKFEFSLTNKSFHFIFYTNCRLLDTIFPVDHECGYYRGNFLYQNIVKINVMSSLVNMNYLTKFNHLRDLNISQIEFSDREEVNAFLLRLPQTLLSISVGNQSTKEFLRKQPLTTKGPFMCKVILNGVKGRNNLF